MGVKYIFAIDGELPYFFFFFFTAALLSAYINVFLCVQIFSATDFTCKCSIYVFCIE